MLHKTIHSIQWPRTIYYGLLLLLLGCYPSFGFPGDCDCPLLEVTSSNKALFRKHGPLLGSYSLINGREYMGQSIWKHQQQTYYLFRSNLTSRWAISSDLGSDLVMLENRGRGCPGRLHSSWRFLDGDLGSFVEDKSLRVLCPSAPCGSSPCGHGAKCDQEQELCTCEEGSTGDPYTRCYPKISSLCNCARIVLSTDSQSALDNQGESYGEYHLYGQQHGHPIYQHEGGLQYLYHQDGSWLVSDQLGSRSGGIQNQGDPSMCPYRFKTVWEYADISKSGWQWVYDYETSMTCSEDACSKTKCGQRATCTDQGGEASCSCDIGFHGNPYDRCYPVEVPVSCPCTDMLVISSGEAAKTQSDKLGVYHLYGYYQDMGVYQHQSGLEYLFHAHGQAWAIGASVGGMRVGIINFSNNTCPYKVPTPWKHSLKGKLQVDDSLKITCIESLDYTSPQEFLQMNIDSLDYSRFPETIESTTVSQTQDPPLSFKSFGTQSVHQLQANTLKQLQTKPWKTHTKNTRKNSNKKKRKPQANSKYKNQWEPIEEEFGTSTVSSGIVTLLTGQTGVIPTNQLAIEELENNNRPTSLEKLNMRRHDVQPTEFFENLAEEIEDLAEDEYLHAQVPEYDLDTEESIKLNFKANPAILTPKPTSKPKRSKFRTPRTPLPKIRNVITAIPNLIKTTVRSTTAKYNKAVYTANKRLNSFLESIQQKITPRNKKPHPTKTVNLKHSPSSIHSIQQVIKPAALSKPGEQVTGVSVEVMKLCNCTSIIVTSSNPTTVRKHSKELGQYQLSGELFGRPVYRHIDGSYYLYYQQYSGGNWLINTDPGLLYGGIQNSKDFPVCPYLLPTVWQFGDSAVGGWVYDPSLTVTCPTDPCSVVKCGFRAQCERIGGQALCLCRSGYSGDAYSRCYPIPSSPAAAACQCKHIKVASKGEASLHQRDKMGDYFLWGYYNKRPVYQHYSGLDFIYFHKNQVWGVGPKVGGKRAGLLNFGTDSCPYMVTTPWQYGTKSPDQGRQLDTHLEVFCEDEQ